MKGTINFLLSSALSVILFLLEILFLAFIFVPLSGEKLFVFWLWWHRFDSLQVRNTSTNVVPVSGNSSMKKNGGINVKTSNILNARNGQNGVDVEQNHSAEARKANPNAVLANEKKAATQLGVIVGMSNLSISNRIFSS